MDDWQFSPCLSNGGSEAQQRYRYALFFFSSHHFYYKVLHASDDIALTDMGQLAQLRFFSPSCTDNGLQFHRPSIRWALHPRLFRLVCMLLLNLPPLNSFVPDLFPSASMPALHSTSTWDSTQSWLPQLTRQANIQWDASVQPYNDFSSRCDSL